MSARRTRTPAERAADRLIGEVATSQPDTVTLAEVVALAVRVDPALLRAARHEFVPHRGPDLEADLWHSPLVSSSNRSGIVLQDMVAERLLIRLASSSRERYDQARRVIVAEHGGFTHSRSGWPPDTLRLEEELRYLAFVPGGHGQARRLYQQVRSQVERAEAEGLRWWLKGLDSRLPTSLRGSVLPMAATEQRAGVRGLTRPPGGTFGVRLLESAVEVCAAPYGAMHGLRLPDGPPPAVFIEGRLVPLETLPHVEPVARPDLVTVQALDGASMTLRREGRQPTPRLPRVLRGHATEVWGCAFSSDGSLFVTTSADRTVRLWDAATAMHLHTLVGHSSRVHACALTPDGALLASAGADGTVRLWDTSDGGLLDTLSGHRGPVEACAFSPDGALLASAGADGTVRLWDAGHWAPLGTLDGHTGAVRACAFSPSADGTVLATAGNDRTVRLWDPTTGTAIHKLDRHADVVQGCAFSPDGSVLATASRDLTVRMWDVEEGTELQVLTGHTNSVLGCTFSPDGAVLVTAGNDRTVRLWDPTTGTAIDTLRGHTDWVRSCAFSPDGSVLATTSGDGTVRFWDPAVTPPRQRLAGHTSWIHACAYAPDGSLLATGSADQTVRLWDPPTGMPLRTLTGHANSVEDCAFSPDGKLLATAGADGTIRIWRPGTGRLVRLLEGHADRVHDCTFSPDGSILATASDDGTVRLWDPGASEPLLRTLSGHKRAVRGCAFSPDGSILATASDDGTVRLWDPATGAPLRRLTAHLREVLACAFSADGTRLASASSDQTVRLWDPATGAHLATLRGHTSRVHACAFAPDGSVLATASADRTIRVWDPVRAELLDTLAGPTSMLDCMFSPDGTVIAAAGTNQTTRGSEETGQSVRVWDLLTRQVAVKGDTVALWLGGTPDDAAAVAGAVAARPRTASCTPVVATGGGAVPGVLLAAGLHPRSVRRTVVSTVLGRRSPTMPLARWQDPVRRLARRLADLGVATCGDLRVPVGHPLHRYRYHAVVVDVATRRLVVLPRDARRVGLDPDAIPLADLVVAASGTEGDVVIGGRRFASALGRIFDPGPWYRDPPVRHPVLAIDVKDRQGRVPARHFPDTLPVTAVTIPWLHVPGGTLPSRRHREVLARIGAQSLRAALTDGPAPSARTRVGSSIRRRG